jgi:hypothetical protein
LKGYDLFKCGVVLAFGTLALTGCGGSGGGADEASGPENLSPAAQPMSAEVQSLVDQGNTAQREGRYTDALELYQEAMELDPQHPIPQFGALMAATTLGDSALIASLSASLEASAPELLGMLAPGGGMGGGMGMPPVADSLTGGLPPGHPTLPEASVDTLPAGPAGSR